MSKPTKYGNKSIARKAVLLAPHLTNDDRLVAGWIIEHHNLETGLCFPSLGRLAFLAKCCEKSVRRAVKKLAGGERYADGTYKYPVLIPYVSNGGPGGASLYQIDFEEMNRMVDEIESRFRELKSRASSSNGEPASDDGQENQADDTQSDSGHSCPITRTNMSKSPDNNVHQNHPINHLNKPIGEANKNCSFEQSRRRKSNNHLRVPTKPPSHRTVAEKKANDSYINDLKSRLSKAEFEAVVSGMDQDIDQEAVDAEMKKKGSGAQLVIDRYSEKGPAKIGSKQLDS